MTNERFHELFGGPPRGPDELLTQRHMDLAASIQAVTDEVVLRLTRRSRAETGAENLCLAGGVALNCVANGKVLRDGRVRAALGPAGGRRRGGALGAALCGYHLFRGQPRSVDGAARRHAGRLPRARRTRRRRSRRGSARVGARFTVAGRRRA